MPDGLAIEPLAARHDRKSFSCGVAPLDQYLWERATQDARRRVSNCFVLCDDAGKIAGYYSFAATSLPISELSPSAAKRLPRYPLLPAALIGRLAVDVRFRRQGLGGAMVIDAAVRAAKGAPAIYALLVEAKDDEAVAFYRRLGFVGFISKPRTLYLPLETAMRAVVAG